MSNLGILVLEFCHQEAIRVADTHKNFSLLGDSISTFQGFTPPGGVYYGPSFGSITGVYSVEDTWWMQVIRALGGQLLANNSWSGSAVSSAGSMSACSSSRIRKLAADGVTPDHVLVFSGLNDVNQYVPEGRFGADYELMLRRIREAYPQAAVTCGTLITGYLSNTPFHRQLTPFRERLIPYNAAIRRAAAAAGCQVADLARLDGRYPSMDGLHPNGEGMAQLAQLWLDAMQVP